MSGPSYTNYQKKKDELLGIRVLLREFEVNTNHLYFHQSASCQVKYYNVSILALVECANVNSKQHQSALIRTREKAALTSFNLPLCFFSPVALKVETVLQRENG